MPPKWKDSDEMAQKKLRLWRSAVPDTLEAVMNKTLPWTWEYYLKPQVSCPSPDLISLN